MQYQRALKKINRQIIKWSQERPKLVVGIDGYTGIGKTTLLKNLSKINSNVLPVHWDDFLLARVTKERLLKKSKDKSKIFELKNNYYDRIRRLIAEFKNSNAVYKAKTYNYDTGKIDVIKSFDLSKKIMAVEGVFLFHPKLLNNVWNKRIYIDGNTKEIDTRRIKREKKKWGKNYFPETHPNSHFRLVIIALERYRKLYKPDKIADLLVKV